jgi:hypothetical protein
LCEFAGVPLFAIIPTNPRGGSMTDEPSDESSDELTPAELLAEARGIMREANERAARLMRRFDELTG